MKNLKGGFYVKAKFVQCALPIETYKILQDAALEYGLTRSAMMREILKQWAEAHVKKLAEENKDGS